MIFNDFASSQYFGSVTRACTGAQESKKVEVAKDELKHTQTIIECYIKLFKIRLRDLGCHMIVSMDYMLVPIGRGKPFNITFYDRLRMFGFIFGDFDFFRFLCTHTRTEHPAK